MEANQVYSWGRYPQVRHRQISKVSNRVFQDDEFFKLPVGRLRSYGDVCLNEGHNLVSTQNLSCITGLDAEKGILFCEAGVTIAELIQYLLSSGWQLPVVPGTKFVSVGGAIANDIHGKNHQCVGSFGCHLVSFELLRSDQGIIRCSKRENSDLFFATIGGLGLTGVILRAEIKLQRKSSEQLQVQTVPFRSFSEYLSISDESAHANDEYSVAWIDFCQSKVSLRGLFHRGRFSSQVRVNLPKGSNLQPRINLYSVFPNGFVNRVSNSLFSEAYKFSKKPFNVWKPDGLESFLFPLDFVANWNLIYGKRGFTQLQFVIPGDDKAESNILSIFNFTRSFSSGSFLTVLKSFGEKTSGGLLSFPKPGVTVTIDFSMGPGIPDMIRHTHQMISGFGGRVYPAKDCFLQAETFKIMYPNHFRFAEFVDPKISSMFWRRVNQPTRPLPIS